MIGFLELVLSCIVIVVGLAGIHEYSKTDEVDIATITYTLFTYEIEYDDKEIERIEAHTTEQHENTRLFRTIDDIEYIEKYTHGDYVEKETSDVIEVSLHNVKSIRPIDEQEDEWTDVPMKSIR